MTDESDRVRFSLLLSHYDNLTNYYFSFSSCFYRNSVLVLGLTRNITADKDKRSETCTRHALIEP